MLSAVILTHGADMLPTLLEILRLVRVCLDLLYLVLSSGWLS
jgi:hypothetical protein